MTIRHHLTDALLMAYSAGQLPEAFALVAATHISLCDECRARLSAYDAVGGTLIEGCAPAAMDETSLTATLARLTGAGAPARPRRPERPAPGLFPAPLRDYVGGDLAAVKWRPVGLGVRQAILPTAPGGVARLLYIPAGRAVPDHGHRGTELTLVLQGAFRDASDRFGPGDLEVADQGVEHTPVAETGADCICLAATDAPLRFKSLLPRLARPFLRM